MSLSKRTDFPVLEVRAIKSLVLKDQGHPWTRVPPVVHTGSHPSLVHGRSLFFQQITEVTAVQRASRPLRQPWEDAGVVKPRAQADADAGVSEHKSSFATQRLESLGA